MSVTVTTPAQLVAHERSAELERAINAAPRPVPRPDRRPAGRASHLGHLFGTLADVGALMQTSY